VNASTQSTKLGASDLAVLLALVRSGTLAGAGALLGVDGSTVFRTVQRAEKALGQRLFERSRAGYRSTDLGLRLAQHAEAIEAELDAARSAVQSQRGTVSGSVRITLTDTVLHGLVLPALRELMTQHPHLQLEARVSNELANLTQREADIAVRATRRPPAYLVGRELGPIRVAIYAARPKARGKAREIDAASAPWLAVDDALPEHPSVRWRRKHLPRVEPAVCLNGVQAVFDAVRQGLGVGIAPLFLAALHDDVVALTPSLADCETQLWLLTHPESRHLRRIQAVASHLAQTVQLA